MVPLAVYGIQSSRRRSHAYNAGRETWKQTPKGKQTNKDALLSWILGMTATLLV